MTGQAEAIKIKPTPKQLEAYQACEGNKIVLYGGAIRGGKSYFLILYAFTMAFKYPKSRWLLLRESLPTLRRTLLVTFQEFLNNGFNQYVADYNQQSYTITLTNGSQLIFMAESFDTDKELNRFRGLEINGALIDEVNEIQEVTFDKVLERSGSWFHSKGCPVKIIMSCNPTQGWVKERFYEPYKKGLLPSGVAYIPARITDNPYIPEEYLESLKMLPRYQYEVFVNGDWDIQLKTGGEFYKCFELDTHVVEDIHYDPNMPLHISWDDNVNPYLPLGIFQIHKRLASDGGVDGYNVYMIDEIAGQDPRNTVRAVCDEFKRKYPNHAGGLFVYGDATARKDDTKLEKGHDFYRIVTDNLKAYKPSLRVLSSNPSVKMRGDFINTVLEKELFGLRIFINKNCKFAINDFIGVKEAADGTKNKEMDTDPKTKVRYQKYGHFTDLFDYFFVSAFGAEFAKYQKGGIDLVIRMGKVNNGISY